jgi:hypothetical protein
MFDKLFVIQLIVSFVVGGGLVALLTIVAEKVNQRIAGIILTFPITGGMSIFFLGWTTSAEAVVEVIPSIFITMGVVLLFISIYPYIAQFIGQYIENRVLQILISYFLGVGIWFVLAVPTIIFEFNNYLLGVLGYILLNMLSHFILTRKTYKKPVTLTYTVGQKIGRAAFVGFIMSLVVLLGKVSTPFWGGMFTMFPAAFSSVLIIIHWYYGINTLFPILRKVAVGSLSVFSYVNIVKFTFPELGIVLGTIVAFLGSVIVSLLLIMYIQSSWHNKLNDYFKKLIASYN